MSFEPPRASRIPRLLALGASTPLLKAERITLLALVAAGIVLALVFVVASPPDELPSSLLELVLTADFALFAWSPVTAVAAFLATTAASFPIGHENPTLSALAIAVGCIVRTGTRPLIAVFAGGFLLSAAAAVTFAVPAITLVNFVTLMLVATVASAVGLLLATIAKRERRLSERLRAKEKAEQEAALAERQRIADELHDVIAHDLTVIAMHSHVLEQPVDAEIRAQSRQTIQDAARKALGDLRRVVDQAQGPAVLAEAPRESLAEVLDSARSKLAGVASPLLVHGDPADPRLPRLLDGALARILRESVTNVLKHGAPGTVDVTLGIADDTATMSIRSPLPPSSRRGDLPSGGYGLLRMKARAEQLGGRLTAGPDRGSWIVAVSFPLA